MRTLITLVLLAGQLTINGQVEFDRWFTDRTMRFDFHFAGNSNEITVYPGTISEEPHYAGSLKNLIDPFNSGNIRYEVRDAASGTLIFSRGYGTLFQEWQTTAEAKEMNRAFYEVIKFPYPKNPVELTIKKFERDGRLSVIYSTTIDPANYFILHEKLPDVSWSRIAGNGDPHKSVDIAFIAEGYTADEMQKFRDDVTRLKDILFATEPFSKHSKKINIWAVEAVSGESGTDIPGEGIYVNTALNSSFYTFDLDRYLTTFDIKSVNDYASVVPHDNIVVVINSERYGGGGMYNYYSGTTAGHPLTPQVFTHEFGHGFAGLADEYYSSAVAYDEFYPLDSEPWEANITTMVNFASKWEKMLGKGTPVPTPATEEYAGTVGLFEGGGYSGKGIFRPQLDCRMKSNEAEGFCKVCSKALEEMILFYTR